MTTVIFVHGTGTRQQGYEMGFQRVKQAITERRPDVRVEPCFWAGEFGVKLNAGGASIPGYGGGGRGLSLEEVEGSDEYEVALWALLYGDPLYELRTAAQLATPGAAPSEAALAIDARFRAWQPDPAEGWAEAELGGQATAARDAVADSEPYGGALAAAGSDEGLALLLARALVAEAMAAAEHEGVEARALVDADLRDRLVQRVAASLLGEGTRGAVGDWLRARTGDLLMNAATSYMKPRRAQISDATLPGVGDIMYYMAHGEGIRGFVADRIRAARGPVVLLAHSLGGIISVELLIRQHLPQVALLATVGSQSPFLYEIDALPQLRFGKPLPAHFPRWINLYDPHDFLSYTGEGIFPTLVRDIEINSRQPFPRAHSSYWTTAATWDALVAELP